MHYVHLGLRDVLTAVALTASLWALSRSYRLDKRDLFLRMHTDLLDEVPMRGRYALSETRDAARAAQSLNDVAESTGKSR